MRTIDHIISPCIPPAGSDLLIAQPITLETMRRAQSHAGDTARVRLLSVSFADEAVKIPGFHALSPLSRSAASLPECVTQRKLPFLKDILDRACTESSAEYIIYTNIDIGLQPHFYSAVHEYIEKGYDAFVINRRTLPAKYTSVEEIEMMHKEKGLPHPGYDCFVFKRTLYSQFVIGNVFLGSGHVDTPLVCSMIAAGKKFGEFRDDYLTFHIGDSQSWFSWKNHATLRANDHLAANALLELARQKCYIHRMRPWVQIMLRTGCIKNSVIVREWKRLRHCEYNSHPLREF